LNIGKIVYLWLVFSISFLKGSSLPGWGFFLKHHFFKNLKNQQANQQTKNRCNTVSIKSLQT